MISLEVSACNTCCGSQSDVELRLSPVPLSCESLLLFTYLQESEQRECFKHSQHVAASKVQSIAQSKVAFTSRQ